VFLRERWSTPSSKLELLEDKLSSLMSYLNLKTTYKDGSSSPFTKLESISAKLPL
jgi:hypothetical protein